MTKAKGDKKKTGGKKYVKILIIGMLVMVLAAGAVIVVSAMNNEELPEASDDANVVTVEDMTIDTSSDYAKTLYGYKVSDTVDSAAVAKLMEAMNLSDITGEYSITISAENDEEVMTLTLNTPVNAKDKMTFDTNMEKCVQQIFALVPGLSQIKWTYSVEAADTTQETATLSMDKDGASEGLAHNIDYYSDSVKKFQKLLQEQVDN